MMARTRQHSFWESVAFSAIASTTWEYVYEANGVRPSGVDLWFTPLAGAVFGEARYWMWTEAGKIEHRGLRHVTQAVLDPFGTIERAMFW